MAPTFHTGGRGLGLRNTASNFTFNHIGHFAAAGHAVAKSLFLGGVTRRFPGVNFGFLEGGVGWGCQLFADLIEHWERRGKAGLEYMDPKKLDRPLLAQLVDKYGYSRTLPPNLSAGTAGRTPRMTSSTAGSPSTTTTPRARSPAKRTGSTSTPSRSISAARPTTG